MHVIVTTDGSAASTEAATYLRSIADPAVVDRVTVVAVVSPLAAVPFATDAEPTISSPEELSFRRSAERATAALAEQLRDWGPDVATEVRSGSPAAEIVRAARDHGADLVVMANRSTHMQSLLLGSVAHRVMNDAPCAVLVVRPS